ncbi:hypothetical protein SPRG_06296 [Saprolegnia parasitica CBS 223.65]|uniref:Yeast cell wall synthesis Kre9/Knh1-like N-terminal domain-containing protein n=1 Tax=Saprolegnia parasitica (strain CBS 223.65) TaxID=695850 RepID=A0A067CP04_SAPPC|nr:hypothetical protein SPRG_06296 [Saprolegnia parasitica CBS 223.65]KDO28246.1 hypothetical protein SPRG_06296 [Saprolegnia parasitica CBS 223.65]|eukprot:XP_012201069.1 hypothetical protein SPRG_06296 [Saprolegnia parasitica CBS 223.65]
MLECETMTPMTTTNQDEIFGYEHNSAMDMPELPSTPETSPRQLVRSKSWGSLARAATTPKLLNVRAPKQQTHWRRSQPAILQWAPLDISVAEIRIVLLQKSSLTNTRSYTIIADHVENNGLFVLKQVPASLTKDKDYFVRFMSMDGKLFVDSETFSIGE